jgi:hypothetical protein
VAVRAPESVARSQPVDRETMDGDGTHLSRMKSLLVFLCFVSVGVRNLGSFHVKAKRGFGAKAN